MIKRFILHILVFLLSISFPGSAEEKDSETPFEYNLRWYRNDFKWWSIWHRELYGNLGKEKIKDVYNVKQVIDSLNKLKKWVIPEREDIFRDYVEFYEMVKREVEKGNLKAPRIKAIKSLLKEKEKEFIERLHYKKINSEEWISKEINDKSSFEKVEIMPVVVPKEKTGFRYVAHRFGRAFHKLNCSVAEEIKETDRVYFKTKRRALSTNRKACRSCKP